MSWSKPILPLLIVLQCSIVCSQQDRGVTAPKPLFRDPVFDGSADPVVVWSFAELKWFMFYTIRRANLPEGEIDRVNCVHVTKIGIAE